MNYAYKTIGQWTKHLITISRDRFGKDIGELTQEELSEASQIIKDFNINEATKQLSNTNLIHNTMNDFRVVRTRMIDVDSVHIDIHYGSDDEIVASGQYNIRTNWAHVTREEVYENMLGSDWEDEMQEAIENRVIEIA